MQFLKTKQAQYRENQIGVNFTPCPSQTISRVYINGQILSAQRFPYSQLYISYKFSLPKEWRIDIDQEKLKQLTQLQQCQLNCLASITHSVRPIMSKDKYGSSITKYNFCFPFDLQLIVPSLALEHDWPKILFEVFERDSWDRIFMHGCGFIQIPNHPGCFTLQTPTWKPNQSDPLSQFFLGGLIRPKNIEDIARTYDVNEMETSSPINRSQFTTLSSGNILTRINVGVQSKGIRSEERDNKRNIKRSEKREIKKEQISRKQAPSQVNTGLIQAGRYTNVNL